MQRVHGQLALAGQAFDEPALLDRHGVRRSVLHVEGILIPLLVPQHAIDQGELLVQGAAQAYVEFLEAPADRE